MAQARGVEWGRAERAVPVAEHGLEHEYREVVWRAPPHALDCERKVDREHRIVPDAHFGAHKVCLRVQRRRFGRHGSEEKCFSASWTLDEREIGRASCRERV